MLENVFKSPQTKQSCSNVHSSNSMKNTFNHFNQTERTGWYKVIIFKIYIIKYLQLFDWRYWHIINSTLCSCASLYSLYKNTTTEAKKTKPNRQNESVSLRLVEPLGLSLYHKALRLDKASLLVSGQQQVETSALNKILLLVLARAVARAAERQLRAVFSFYCFYFLALTTPFPPVEDSGHYG